MANKKPEQHHVPNPPGRPNGGHVFEKKVLDSLERIEKSQLLLVERTQTLDNKIDLLIAKVEECCEDKPPPPAPRPTGVRIDQVERVH